MASVRGGLAPFANASPASASRYVDAGLPSPHGVVLSVDWSPGSDVLAYAGADHTVRIASLEVPLSS